VIVFHGVVECVIESERTEIVVGHLGRGAFINSKAFLIPGTISNVKYTCLTNVVAYVIPRKQFLTIME
jgi:CRP-like cAMP-binding protein